MAWTPDYASPTELAVYMSIDDNVDDVQLGLAVTAASRAVDRSANRQFGKVDTPVVRTYRARWDRDRGQWCADIRDLMDVTGLLVATPAATITAYELGPLDADEDGMPWTRLYVDHASSVQPTLNAAGEARITVAALWGWNEIPDTIKQATLLQGSRFMTRRVSPLGVAGSPELGSEIRLLAKVDPDVAVMIAPYRRRRRLG